jgi:hypothetical protein
MSATMAPPSTREKVAEALKLGGRARVTVTSKASGQHLTILLTAKKRDEEGRFISRTRIAGRVGIEEADVLFADAADAAWGGYVARFDFETGEWRWPKSYDDERGPHYLWAAKAIMQVVVSDDETVGARFDNQCDVALASECCVCAKALTDPESIERGIGPECANRATKSKHV